MIGLFITTRNLNLNFSAYEHDNVGKFPRVPTEPSLIWVSSVYFFCCFRADFFIAKNGQNLTSLHDLREKFE